MNSYTGHVDPAGPPSSRVLREISITKLSVGPMDNNAYLLADLLTHDAVLIDAANDSRRLLALINGEHPGYDAVRVRAIITTHRHPDHWQALEDAARYTDATLYAGAEDAPELPVPVDVPLVHGDAVEVGAMTLGVIGLRGHTPGSVALLYREPGGVPHLFTGDSLFPGGVGRTTSSADFSSLIDDIETRVFGVLPDDTWVYPGHGDDTTIGAERPHLAEWRARGW